MSEKSYLVHHEQVKSYTDVNFLDLDSHRSIRSNIIDGHAFNQAMTVFLPTCSINLATEHLNTSLGVYYQVEAPLRILLEPSFFNTFIKSPNCQLMMHTVKTNLNTDDVAVLNPDGKLYLSLVKQSFETFGMEALKRTKDDVKHNKHIVMVDLKEDSFKENSNKYNRLKWCLENTLKRTFAMVFCATDTTTGSTIDIQWPATLIARIEKHDMTPELETLTDIYIPSFSNLEFDITQKPTELWDQQAADAIEWLGLAHLKASRIKKTNKELNPFISVYKQPTPQLKSQTGTLVKWKGFIPTFVIQSILTNIRKMMASGVTNSWTSLSVWGYKDSPYTWNNKPHYHFYNGENDYTFLLLNSSLAYTYQHHGH